MTAMRALLAPLLLAAALPAFAQSGDGIDILRQRLSTDPGTRYHYDSALQHLLSAIVTHATGLPMARCAERELFAPLGIARYNWFADDEGYSYGSHDLFLAPQDMARIGQLYLDDGMWRGRRLLDEGFARTAVIGLVPTGEPAAPTYGYAWRQTHALGTTPAYAAAGFGGQYVFVVPSQRLVVAAHSDDDERGPGAAFLREVVLPAFWRN
jgi:CubicO group peptidase (beta-lactamase class C family)